MARSQEKRKAAFGKAGTGQFKSISKQTGGPASTQGISTTSAPPIRSHLTDPSLAVLPEAPPPTSIDQQAAVLQQKFDAQKTISAQVPKQGLNFAGAGDPLMNALQSKPTDPFATPPGGKALPSTASAANAGAKKYTGDNAALRAIQNYFDFADRLVPTKPDGGYDTQIFTPGMGIKQITGKVAAGIIGKGAQAKVKETIKSFFIKDVTKRMANGRWKTTSRLNWEAMTGTIAALTLVVQQSLGGKNFGNFIGKEEASQLTIGARMAAEKYGNFEDRQEARDLTREAMNFDAGSIPIKNVAEGLEKYQSIGLRALEIEERIDRARTAEIGEEPTDEERSAFWINHHRETLALESAEMQARTERFNSERIAAETEIIRLKEESSDRFNASRLETTKADLRLQRKAIEQQAAFWLEYKRKTIELETQQMEEQRAFWLDYRKMTLQMQAQESGGSRLGFGLFR